MYSEQAPEAKEKTGVIDKINAFNYTEINFNVVSNWKCHTIANFKKKGTKYLRFAAVISEVPCKNIQNFGCMPIISALWILFLVGSIVSVLLT